MLSMVSLCLLNNVLLVSGIWFVLLVEQCLIVYLQMIVFFYTWYNFHNISRLFSSLRYDLFTHHFRCVYLFETLGRKYNFPSIVFNNPNIGQNQWIDFPHTTSCYFPVSVRLLHGKEILPFYMFNTFKIFKCYRFLSSL